MNTCADCNDVFNLDEGGFIWETLVFCEDCDPLEDKYESSGTR